MDAPPKIPIESSRFIGRERDLASLQNILSNSRLVTIVGPPGVGKTRLAVHLAGLKAPEYADGASFLDLASVNAADSLIPAIAEQLALNLDSRNPAIDSMTLALASREALLVLDNCEHIVDEAASVCESLLTRCEHLRIVATSREPLRVDGEVIWQLAPLGLPRPDSGMRELREVQSVALFVDRATARKAGFSLTDANASHVAAICNQVDGVPLAIELAAALVGSLSVEDIAKGITRSLSLLVRGHRLVGRQRTLRSAMDWSYSLLSEREQRTLRQIPVVLGDFDMAAARSICGEDGVSESEVESLILELAEKSLVMVVPRDGLTRYRLLEPIRQYGFERLTQAGEEASARDRHLAHYLALAEAAEPSLMSGHRESSLKSLGLELHNIRRALEWGLGEPEPARNDAGARLAAALLWFWSVTGDLTEGMNWLHRAARPEVQLATETRAKVLYSGGELAWLLGEESLGRTWLEASANLWRGLADQRRVAYCLQALSFLVEPELGRELAQESIDIFQSVKDEWGTALATHTIGLLESQRGSPKDGRAHIESALRHYQTLGDTYLMVQALNLLGDLDRDEGDYEQARVDYEAALALVQASPYQSIRPSILQNLGFVAFRLDEIDPALQSFLKAIKLFVDQGDRRGVAEGLTGIAGVLTKKGDLERAATLLGASSRLLEDANATLWRSNRDDARWTEEQLRARLGESGFAMLVAEGRKLSPAGAVDTAFGAGGFLRSAPDRRGLPLSPREQEVATLVARGYRNRQIAEALVISEATARLHVKHILRRLGFSSRAEIAAWAVSRGLLSPEPEPAP
jgi:non-specific serine/threonine protein kinase